MLYRRAMSVYSSYRYMLRVLKHFRNIYPYSWWENRVSLAVPGMFVFQKSGAKYEIRRKQDEKYIFSSGPPYDVPAKLYETCLFYIDPVIAFVLATLVSAVCGSSGRRSMSNQRTIVVVASLLLLLLLLLLLRLPSLLSSLFAKLYRHSSIQ